MDAKEIITLLDEIISNIEDDGIKLGKKEIRLINEIVSDTEKLILKEKKEDKRQELLSRLDKVSGAISDSESISQESAQKIIDAIEKIKINPIVQVKQPEIIIPEFDTSKLNIVLPKEMGIKEPSWLSKVVNLTPLVELLGQIESIFSKKAKDPIAVRLSDGEKFYKAISGGSSSGGIIPFKNDKGETEYARLNSSGQLVTVSQETNPTDSSKNNSSTEYDYSNPNSIVIKETIGSDVYQQTITISNGVATEGSIIKL